MTQAHVNGRKRTQAHADARAEKRCKTRRMQNRRRKKKAARPSRRAAEILSDVISVAMNDTRRGFLTASVISLQKFDVAF
jgi:hypothetical protein